MAISSFIQTDQELLSPTEVAAMLRVSLSALATWRSTRRYNLVFIRVGRRIRYRRQDVLRFLEARTVRNEPIE